VWLDKVIVVICRLLMTVLITTVLQKNRVKARLKNIIIIIFISSVSNIRSAFSTHWLIWVCNSSYYYYLSLTSMEIFNKIKQVHDIHKYYAVTTALHYTVSSRQRNTSYKLPSLHVMVVINLTCIVLVYAKRLQPH